MMEACLYVERRGASNGEEVVEGLQRGKREGTRRDLLNLYKSIMSRQRCAYTIVGGVGTVGCSVVGFGVCVSVINLIFKNDTNAVLEGAFLFFALEHYITNITNDIH